MSKQPHITRLNQRGLERKMPARRVVAPHATKSVNTHPLAGTENAFAPVQSNKADEQAATFNNSGGKY